METIYSLEGWVKETIDNENAEMLQQFNIHGAGDAGKQSLVEMAKSQFDFWKKYCQQLETTNNTAVYIHVYANAILPNGLLCREENGTVYKDYVKIDPRKKGNANI